jgi:hypothetical protein
MTDAAAYRIGHDIGLQEHVKKVACHWAKEPSMHCSLSRLHSYLLVLFLLLLGAGQAVAQRPTGGPPGLQDNLRTEHLRAAIRTHRAHERELMDYAGVVASGVGFAGDGSAVIKVFVDDTETLRKQDIPESLDGVKVQTQVSGMIFARRGTTCEGPTDGVCETYDRWPLPVPIGVSIGHPLITAGTLGARVTDGANVYILSNNHVMAAINSGSIGDPILQPGIYDGGIDSDDTIATLYDYETIVFCPGFWPVVNCNDQSANAMDAAIAWVQPHVPDFVGVSTPIGQYSSVVGYGTPSSGLHPAYGDPTTIGDETLSDLLNVQVQKVGRTTGYTFGSVDAVDVTVDVCYDPYCFDVARFTDQIMIVPGGFSDGGDSGSLIVDLANRPVGLLFAGGETNTIANRIDLVLNRFNVTIDDGGDSGGGTDPVLDLATTSIDVPSPVALDATTTVTVTVQNVGTTFIESATLTLEDSTEPSSISGGSTTVTNLPPGAIASPTFEWTPTTEVTHSLRATHELTGDADASNDAATLDVDVVYVLPDSPLLQLRQVEASTAEWTRVDLSPDYDYGDQMVVVCTPNYDISALGPAIVRVKNATGTSFEVGLARPWAEALESENFTATVHCMVVKEGVYTQAEHGVKMEAVKLPEGATSVDYKGSWIGTHQSLQQAYWTTPVILGQVESPDTGTPPSNCPPACDPDWSVFWSHGATYDAPANSGEIYVGRHSGSDTRARPAESVMYVAIEAGTGNIEGQSYVAALGFNTVYGIDNAPPYFYDLNGLSSASTAIASQAGMKGNDGSWAILYGANPVSSSSLSVALDEDLYTDAERNHKAENVGYIVFGNVGETTGPQLQRREVVASTENWTTVSLNYDYGDQMVVVCTPNYDISALGPAIVRVKNATGTSFEVGLARPWAEALESENFTATVHCMVVKEGVYTQAEHGVKMEAVKLTEGATSVDYKGSWNGTQQSLQNSYGDLVVLGQVESPDTGTPPSNCPPACDPDWSVFWSHGATYGAPASNGAIYVGRHSGSDTRARPAESVMYVAIEGGTGSIDGQSYVAGLGLQSVYGIGNAPPYYYSLNGLRSASTAIASQAGMKGNDGSWAILYGANPVSSSSLSLTLDEDLYTDAERNHKAENVGYIVFE